MAHNLRFDDIISPAKESFTWVVNGRPIASILPLLTVFHLPLLTVFWGKLPIDIAESPYILEAQEESSHMCRIDYGARLDTKKYQPRTLLAKKLLAIRERAISNGMILLSEEEVLKEVESRRGETHHV